MFWNRNEASNVCCPGFFIGDFGSSTKIETPSQLLFECRLGTLEFRLTIQLTLGSFTSSSVPSSSPRPGSLVPPPQLILHFLHELFQVLLSQLSTCFSQRPTNWFTLNASTMNGTDTAIDNPTICVSIKNVEEANRLRNSHKYPERWCSCQEVIPLESLGNCATLNAKNVAMNDRGNCNSRQRLAPAYEQNDTYEYNGHDSEDKYCLGMLTENT